MTAADKSAAQADLPGYRTIRFDHQRRTAKTPFKKVKQASNWKDLSYQGMARSAACSQLHALAYNLDAFLKATEQREEKAGWSQASFQIGSSKQGLGRPRS